MINDVISFNWIKTNWSWNTQAISELTEEKKIALIAMLIFSLYAAAVVIFCLRHWKRTAPLLLPIIQDKAFQAIKIKSLPDPLLEENEKVEQEKVEHDIEAQELLEDLVEHEVAVFEEEKFEIEVPPKDFVQHEAAGLKEETEIETSLEDLLLLDPTLESKIEKINTKQMLFKNLGLKNLDEVIEFSKTTNFKLTYLNLTEYDVNN